MGIAISADDNGRFPRDLRVVLTCDAAAGPCAMFPTVAIFLEPGFISAYSMAMANGWKDTFAGGRRVFLCGCCSGK